MTLLRFHRDDYRESPRRFESSEKVVRYWFDGRVVYDVETAVADEDCLGIIAERIVLRRLLGIDGGEKKHVPYVLDARPFGEDGPKCAELLLSDVFVAMAFVPLTPPDSRGRPILARLYCVNGLSKRYFPSPLRADAVPDGKLYSWFLTGLPDEKHDAAIDGNSWLLAAELLKHVVTKRDVATARNLATKFIVTGDVGNGLITKVEMGRKNELALRHAYRDFKWIIPKENDMSNVPKRKIEKPATLEEAYSLIESMQSVATKSMFRFLREGDLEGVKEQYRNGADIYAHEKNGAGLVPLEVVAAAIDEEVQKIKDGNPSGPKETHDNGFKKDPPSWKIEELQNIMLWLKHEGADCALMFYLLAKQGDESALANMAEKYPINAVDEHGYTAVDWAFCAEEWDVARRLHACGGRNEHALNGRLSTAVRRLFNGWMPENSPLDDGDRVLIVNAIGGGLSPKIRQMYEDRWCSIFEVALWEQECDLVEAFLHDGVDPQADLVSDFSFVDDFGRQQSVEERRKPMDVVVRLKESEKKERLKKLLKDYGAMEA